VKTAVTWYLKDELVAFTNPYGLLSQTMGKRSTTFGHGQESANVAEAESILSDYLRMT
jgi:hypothetical protein